jgi:hypothetical protein
MLSDIMVGALLILVLASGYRAPILIRCAYESNRSLVSERRPLECALKHVYPMTRGRHLRQATTRDWQRLVVMEQALQLVIDLLHLPLFLIVLGTGYYFLEMAVDMSAQVQIIHIHVYAHVCIHSLYGYMCTMYNVRIGYLIIPMTGVQQPAASPASLIISL